MEQLIKKSGTGFCIAVLLCLTTIGAFAQDPSKLYVQGGAGGGSHQSFDYDFSVKTVFNKKWSMTLAYKGLEMTPKNQPADYRPETGYVLFIPYTYEVTADMTLVSITGGRLFQLTRNIWVTTEAGFSYVKGEKVNYKKVQQVDINAIIAGSTSSNYETTKEDDQTVGVMLQSDINWGFCSFIGLGAGVYANINSIQSPVGFNIKLLVGKMGNSKRHKP